MPVIFPDVVTHSSIKIEDAAPISTGFAAIINNRVQLLPGASESLKLGPDADDQFYLQCVVDNMGAYAFI
jgi:hypothetical protein